MFPTLAQIALDHLDALPAQDSSVPCKRMFSAKTAHAEDFLDVPELLERSE
jgi:hypothetical protein